MRGCHRGSGCGAGVTVSLRARVPGADVAAADSGQRGHRSPRRIGCDWWRCGVRCRHSGPRLHWPPILPVSGVSAAWAAPSLTLQTIHGLGPVFLPAGSLLAAGHWTPAWVWSWAWVQTTLRPLQMLYLAPPLSQHIILFIIISYFPFLIHFFCVGPFTEALRTLLTLCVLSNTLKALKYTANCSPLSAARGLQDAANVRLPRIWSPRYFIFNEFAINVRAGITVIMYLKIWTKIIYVHCLLKLKFMEASLKGNLIWREKSLRRTKPCLSFNLAKESKVREIIRK